MKIKCPGCATVLSIPETAAGKVVKCKCGKQLRAPGGNPSAAKPAAAAGQKSAAGARPAGAGPAAKGPAKQRAAPSKPPPPPGGFGGLDADMFDELTDGDLQPVQAVSRPGMPVAAPRTSAGNKALREAQDEVQKEAKSHKDSFTKGASKEVYSSIGILLFLGVLRVGFGVFFLMGAEAEVDALNLDEGPEEMALLLMVVRAVYIINISIGAIFILCAALIFKFPLICAFTAIVVFVIAEIIGLILNPFRIFSFGGWVARCAIFGGLVQTINNAFYYKFVKAGGREGK